MIKKKKVERAFSIVIAWIFLFASILGLSLNLAKENVFAESVNNSLYAFVNQQNNTVNDGEVYVDFGLAIDVGDDNVITRSDAEEMAKQNIVPFESAKIYLRTRNISAITEQGDYEAIDQTFTVLGRSSFASLAVKVNNSGLQVGDASRQFYVEIYKVEITGLKEGYTFLQPNTTKEISSKKLSTGAEIVIDKKKSPISDLYKLDLLEFTYRFSETACLDVVTNTSFNDIKVDLANVGNGWYNKIKYMSSHDMLKLGISNYVAAHEARNGYYVDNSYVGVQFFAGDSKNVGAPALEGVPAKNVYTDASVTELARWFVKFQSNEKEFLSLPEAFNGEFEDVTVSSLFNENVLLPHEIAKKDYGQGGVYDAYVANVDKEVFLIDNFDAVMKDSTVISARYWSYLSSKTKYYEGGLIFIPTNYRAKVESATLGQLYKDENGKEKIGVSLRFNEPLQFKEYSDNREIAPYVKGYINGNAGNEVTFNYVSGEGTDTLFFEADVSNYTMNVTKISLKTAHGFDDVYDFAPNTRSGGFIGEPQDLNVMFDGVVNGWDAILTEPLSCSYDLREPEISINGNVLESVKKSHTTTVRTAYISETGTLYYAWAENNQTVPKNLSSSPISTQGFQTISSSSGISGTRYLYVIAVSELGKQSEPMWVGPFNFDNEAPNLSIDCTKDTYTEKQFAIQLSNNSLAGFDNFASLKESIRVVVSSDANGNNRIKEFSIPLTEDNRKAESVTIENFTLTAEMLGLKEGYGTYYVTFSISDALENQGVSEPISYYFDIREIFDATLVKEDGDPSFEMDEFTIGGALYGSLGNNYYTLDLSKKVEGEDFYFKFKANDDTISALVVDEFKNTANENAESMLSKISGQSNSQSIKITIREKFAPGLYCLILKDVNSDKKSLPIYFYVTNGKDDGRYQEETGGYQAISSNGVFTNKVIQIPTSVAYYYKTDTGEVKTQSYSQTNKPASFSSWAIATEYILYKEYLDLYAVTLTQSLANDLNMGIYRKAEGSKQNAEAGQVWIRYKEVNWDPESSTNEWVYYYYGTDKSVLPINVNALSAELQIALNTVASKICACGKEVHLVTEEYLDKYGAPTLVPEQMHLQTESSIVSMSGTVFNVAIEYLGDLGMYLSLDLNAPLSTNATLQTGEYRRLYYKTEESVYHLLTMDNSETFGEHLNATGKFTILELDENGAREYFVYVDKTAPTVTISWNTQDGTHSKEFSKDDNGKTLSSTNFYIESITDYDKLSFVAIYHYTSQGEGDLLSVYRKSDFDKGQGVRLEDGKYHVYISDRSGNSYAFVLNVKSESLVYKIKEVDNSHIQFEVNRDKEEIRYQVYLDGVLLTTNFDNKRFTKSGQYRFLIEDIYGNKEDITYSFERDLPMVTWRYQISDGNYVLYEKDNEKISIQKIDDQNFVISTSTYLRFLPLDGCAYEIISGTPNPSENMTSGWVTLNNLTTFTMKVYYEMHPDTYVIYTCTVDNSAPQVNVSYEKGYHQPFDEKEIIEKLEKGGFVLGDNPFTPTSIGFSSIADNMTTLYVTNGQKVQSKYFKVQVSDESGVKEVKVYLGDELILTEETDFSHIYLSRRGTYRIVATDKFGNTTTFSFTNDFDERVEYFVDGEKMSTDVSFAEYFDGTSYTKVEYGNTQTEIKLLSSVEVHYIITDAEGKTYYFAFVVEDGVMYTFQYIVKIVNGEYGLEIENVSSRGVKALASGEVAKIDELGVAVYLSKNNNGTLLLTVRSTDSVKKSYIVETRVSVSKNEMPYYFKTKISTIPSSVEFVDGDGNLLNATQTIKVNNAFSVRDNITAEIQSVQVSYSQTGDYTTYETVYDGTYYDNVFNKEGMYHVKVVNKYGIQTDYYVIISSQFVMSATVEYADGTKLNYSTTYEGAEFYSNKSVEFIVYSTNVTILDKHEAMSVTHTSQGYTAIYIAKPGEYLLKIQDEYGNLLEKRIFIAIDTLTIDENLLTGFNEEALRRDENYTNQKVFIDKNALLGEGEIAFISMIYGDKTITIYDNVSEIYTAFDENQCVGIFGDGIYTLAFRDIYGNKAEKVIHYCETPTLTIIRNTLNGVGAETYLLDEMLENGVWTNDRVSFTISAMEYLLKVDGMENVTSIAYDTKTKNEYEVYYLDEYGFKYTFKVYFHREDVVITPVASMSIVQLPDFPVTKNSIQIEFTDNALCTYTLNNETEKVYNHGDVLYRDGIYRFKVVDKAGNVSTYTIKKDSAVEYRLEGSGSREILVNGGVTNGSSVKFFAENSDNAYIKKVFHNNEFIEYDDEIFTERGKWELIIADDAGNEAYFRFYILYGKLDGFSYNTPYNYVITSVVWEMDSSIVDATETIKETGLRLEAMENGKYTVTMQSTVSGDIKTFTFTIDKTPPKVELVGCLPNEKTINNVTLTGCKAGDTIYVYKDGELIKAVRITSDYMDAPTISEAGKYKIVVENEAGIKTEICFERKYVPNVAGSVLIIVLALMSVAGLFVGLIWRNHSKTDD